MKHFVIMLFLTMLYGRSGAQQHQPFLDNEEWMLIHSQLTQGFGSGSVWQFFSDHTFSTTHWYAGGAYWRHQYKGTYHYDPATETVYLMYKKDKKLPEVKKNLCLQIVYEKADSTAYHAVLYNNWKKQNGRYSPLGEQQIIKQHKDQQAEESKESTFSGLNLSFKKGKIQ